MTLGELLRAQKKPGNIDVRNLPSVWNPEENGFSTVWTMGIGTPDGEVLIPRVKHGKILSEEEAKDEYYRTGEHLGIFSTVRAGEEYAQRLHRQQEQSPSLEMLLRSLKF